jgi:hypothetical protein
MPKRETESSTAEDRKELTAEDRKELRQQFVTLPFAILAFLVAVVLVIVVFRAPPKVPSFTQMGGQDRIRTAAEVSRFWPKKAITVVIAPSKMQTTSQVLAAGVYAAERDAPLLFISNPSKLPKAVKTVLGERARTPL